MRRLPLLLSLVLFAACSGEEGPATAVDTRGDFGGPDIATLPGDAMDDTPTLDAGSSDSGADAPDEDTAEEDTSDTAPDADEDVADTATDLPSVDVDIEDIAPDSNDVISDLSDAVECEGDPGCACEAHDECTSNWCVLTTAGVGVCATDDCDSCADGWSCEWRERAGGERAQLCVPGDLLWCSSCIDDEECGAGRCLDLADGAFCAPLCGPDDVCPAGSICRTASEEDLSRVCAPPGDRCIGCTDSDGDGYIAIGECAGVDCDDADPASYPGAPEICDGADNNCVDGADEDWDLLNDIDNCGGCGIACDDSHAELRCEEGMCVIDACDEGFVDCNEDGVDGCEIDVLGEFGCGECPGEDGPLHALPCGECGSGTWECSAGESECVGEVSVMRNVCGGCAELEASPGERCGTCETGLVLCDGSEATRCEGDLGAAAENECAGCEPLDGRPGSRCGTCNSGTYICEGLDDSVCVGDRGEEAINDCGGCTVLPGLEGASCGTCDTGTWACDGAETMVCAGDDPSAANACGGCGFLTETIGTACGECDDGIWSCDGPEAVACEGAIAPGPDGCPDPLCEGRDERALGESCSVPGDCCSGYCPSFAPSERTCSQTCASYADCNVEDPPIDLFCAYDLGSPRLCAVDDYGSPCTGGGECNGRICLTSRDPGACSHQCGSLSDCSPGNACGRFNSEGGGALWACTEIGGPCTEPAECNSGVCLTGPTADYCTTFCEPDGIDGCPAGFSCMALAGDGTFLCLR